MDRGRWRRVRGAAPTPTGTTLSLDRPHATLFVDPAASGPIEALRRRWDPEGVRQMAAHVTLLYPWEATAPELVAAWVRSVAPGQAPFRCRLGPLRRFPTDQGPACLFGIEDVDGGYARFRSAIDAPQFTPGDMEPHVTIVHPRTSRQGDEAWRELQDERLDLTFRVTSVAVTAWDGDRWATVDAVPLGPPDH